MPAATAAGVWMPVLGFKMRLLGGAAAAVLAAPCWGQGGCVSERVATGVPAGCEAVVVVNDAARQRASAAGRGLASMIADGGLMPETAEAWRGLATTREWSSEEAFDELLGRRFTLVMRGLQSPAEAEWAVLTEVSAATERRLRQRLQAAPRGSASGLAVLAVEDGRYELAIGRGVPVDVDSLPEGVAPTVTVLLAPGGRSELFLELAPSLVTRSGLATPPVPWRAGQRERDCDVVVMLREPAKGESAARTLTLAATLERDGWDARVVCSPGLIWDSAERPVKPWSDAPVREFERDALVAVMSVSGSGLPAQGGLLSGLATPLAAFGLERLPQQSSGLCAVVVRLAESWRAGEPRRSLSMGSDGAKRSGGIASVGAPSVPISVTVGMELGVDVRRAGPDSDARAARVLGWLQNGEDPGAGIVAAPVFELGEPERGFRSIQLADVVNVAPELAPLVEQYFGAEPCLTWGVAGKGERTWWVASLGSRRVPATERDADALARVSPATVAARLSTGVVRPAMIHKRLGDAWFSSLGIPLVFRRIDSIRWDASRREDGMIEGTMSVRMTP